MKTVFHKLGILMGAAMAAAPISVATAHADVPAYCGLYVNQMTPAQYKVCSGGYDEGPPAGTSTGFPQCDVYTLPGDRATCANNAAAGLPYHP
jgi:hypothetical protein